jgi:hypothetical protein
VTKDKVAIEKAQLTGGELLASGSIHAATANGRGPLPKEVSLRCRLLAPCVPPWQG